MTEADDLIAAHRSVDVPIKDLPEPLQKVMRAHYRFGLAIGFLAGIAVALIWQVYGPMLLAAVCG